MRNFAPEEFFFFLGGGGQIGVHDGYIDRFTDLKFLCITRLELHFVERNDTDCTSNKMFLGHLSYLQMPKIKGSQSCNFL